ncbi:MAG: sugar phosphate nucleotidyltransferase [bacterium]
MSLTLVVLAAGRGSRYRGLKQVDAVGPAGEALMDYSLYDAAKAGFRKVVFIIRRDIEDQFRTHTGHGLGRDLIVEYAFQELSSVPAGFSVPAGRVKPWGTAHAVLSCRGVVKEPFAVINADDFYGPEAYRVMSECLTRIDPQSGTYCMVGFALHNTLSEHGPVSRAICDVDREGYLKSIVERTRITKDQGIISVALDDGTSGKLTGSERVSMNMWGFTPRIFEQFESEFSLFLAGSGNDPGAEFYMPTAVGRLMQAGKATVKVLETEARWFGITYPEDKADVVKNVKELISAGKYPANVRF